MYQIKRGEFLVKFNEMILEMNIRKKRFTEQQIQKKLKESEAGLSTQQPSRK